MRRFGVMVFRTERVGGSYSNVLYLWAFDRLPKRKVWYWYLVEGETFELLDVAPSRPGRAAFVVGGGV